MGCCSLALEISLVGSTNAEDNAVIDLEIRVGDADIVGCSQTRLVEAGRREMTRVWRTSLFGQEQSLSKLLRRM